MNKKVLIGIIATISVIAILVATIVIVTLTKNKTTPEEIWQKYISNINEGKYEENYEMLTEVSKQNISKEKYIERNKNIYEGIGMNNMQVEITSVEEQEKTAKIRYKTNMETNAGNVELLYTAQSIKDKEKG